MIVKKDKYITASSLLFIGAVIAGGNGIAAKILLRELTPESLTFYRLLIMGISLLPFCYKYLFTIFVNLKKSSVMILMWLINIFFFIYGIKTSTVIVSSLIYSMTPLILLFEQKIISKKNVSIFEMIGFIMSFSGIVLILLLNETSGKSLGETVGGLLILIAATCYAFYLVLVQKNSSFIPIKGILPISSFIGAFISLIIIVSNNKVYDLARIFTLSNLGLTALLYYSILGGSLAWLVNSWTSKYGSPFVSSNSNYISFVAATIFSILILNEKVSLPIIIGGVLILIGVFISVSFKSIFKNKIIIGR